MNAKEVVLLVDRRDDGSIQCRYAFPEDIAKVRPLKQCSVLADGVTFTSVPGTVYTLRREGKTLKGKGINPKWANEMELNYQN